jgi:ubiquitin-protein ligase
MMKPLFLKIHLYGKASKAHETFVVKLRLEGQSLPSPLTLLTSPPSKTAYATDTFSLDIQGHRTYPHQPTKGFLLVLFNPRVERKGISCA